MPGRGNRSKGCLNCRRRKVGCDRKPSGCSRCAKIGEICEGYPSQSFISFEPPRSGINAGNASELGPFTVPPSPIPLPRVLPVASNDDTVFLSYTKHFMLRGISSHFAILDFMDLTNPENDLSRASMVALSTTFFGHSHRRADIIQEGAKQYGKALQQINGVLRNRTPPVSADLISSIVCVGMFEFFDPTSQEGWTYHFSGISQLFEAWGPSCLEFPTILNFFQHCRPLMIFAAMKTGQLSFLAQKKWKKMPLKNVQKHEAIVHQLFDIMSDLPGYVHARGKIVIEKDNHLKEMMIVRQLSKMKVTKQALTKWLAKYVRESGQYHGKEIRSNRMVMNSSGQVIKSWSSTFKYEDLDIANTVCFHDSTKLFLLLLEAQNRAEQSSSDEETERGALITALHHNVRSLAIDICKSAEFHFAAAEALEDGYGDGGAFLLIFPMMMAMRAFKTLEMWPELRWTEDQIERISQGTKMALMVAGSQSYKTTVVLAPRALSAPG